jgi:hypothetical protein
MRGYLLLPWQMKFCGQGTPGGLYLRALRNLFDKASPLNLPQFEKYTSNNDTQPLEYISLKFE